MGETSVNSGVLIIFWVLTAMRVLLSSLFVIREEPDELRDVLEFSSRCCGVRAERIGFRGRWWERTALLSVSTFTGFALFAESVLY